MEKKCLTKNEIINDGGRIIENNDGTVSVFNFDSKLGKYISKNLNLECCKALDNSYTFDIENQQCRWTTVKSCDLVEPINLIINSKGNDGSLFFVDDKINETCNLDINFDYLIKFKCEDLMTINTPVNLISQNSNKINLSILNEETQTKIDNLNNQIILLNSQLDDTPFSIECDSVPIFSKSINEINQTIDLTNFENTGFGAKTANLEPKVNESINYSITKKTYCLTDFGLQEWEKFLGPIRYQAFVNGDSSSYTCNDIDIFINKTYNETVVYECNIEFGSRTKLLNQLNDLSNQLTILQRQNINEINKINEENTLIEEGNSCNTSIEKIENLDLIITLEVINEDGSILTVFESPLFPSIGQGNLYNYLISNQKTGFYICGGDNCTPFEIKNNNETSCDIILDELLNSLFNESGLNSYDTFLNTLNNEVFSSSWLNFNINISDSSIIDLIKNKKINLNIKINNSCSDFCILLDNINLNQNCNQVEKTNILITKNPSFSINRIIDNKKSWVDEKNIREFGINSIKENNLIRQTNYNVDDERLIINSKEIDLNINIATAIETDVWKYITDNDCLLTGETTCNPCEITKNFQDDEIFFFQDDEQYIFMDGGYGDVVNPCCGDNKIKFNELITSDLSKIATINDFNKIITSELIDVKNRQTISSYPTLRALYDRYLNSIDYCNNSSSRFDYYTIDQFANLIGNYWIDIIEQVIPSTTIWGSVKIYTNTIFDEQKFKYKSYSSLFCGNNFEGYNVSCPIKKPLGECQTIEVKINKVFNPNNNTTPKQSNFKCNSICVSQMNYGSEFIGSVTIDKSIITE